MIFTTTTKNIVKTNEKIKTNLTFGHLEKRKIIIKNDCEFFFYDVVFTELSSMDLELRFTDPFYLKKKTKKNL